MTEPHDQQNAPAQSDERRRPYRPPVGMPLRGEGRWGAPFSLAVHVVLILLLITPIFARVVAPEFFGGGGIGPAGGGGGGRGGTGGWRPEPISPEGLRYVRVAPAPPPPAAETEETPAKAVDPPKEDKPPEPAPPPAETPSEEAAPSAAPVPGTGGGTGTDGTNGTGPGSGGGVGSGVGTGTGSGTGPGTGGGPGKDYLPTPDFLPLPPEPRPGKVRGRLVAVTFTVNERGEIVSLDFASTGDRGYDRRFREVLRQVRFRPAVGADGQPIAATFPITFQL